MSEQEAESPITSDGHQIILPTPEEDAAINAQSAADPDDFELDEEWFKNAKPTKELFAQVGLDGEAGGTTWIDLIEQTLQAYTADCAAGQRQPANKAFWKRPDCLSK